MPIEITPEQFVNQWVPGNARMEAAIPSRMSKELHDFTTAAGEYALTRFKSSFDTGSFCGQKKWAPRVDNKWSRKFNHPVLCDFKRLKEGIVGNESSFTLGDWHWPIDGKGRYGADNIFRRKYKYKIITTEFAIPGDGSPKRRGNTNRDKYNYAAVHNTAPEISPFTVNKRCDRKPIQRQFIGHEQNVLDHINGIILPKYLNNILRELYA